MKLADLDFVYDFPTKSFKEFTYDFEIEHMSDIAERMRQLEEILLCASERIERTPTGSASAKYTRAGHQYTYGPGQFPFGPMATVECWAYAGISKANIRMSNKHQNPVELLFMHDAILKDVLAYSDRATQALQRMEQLRNGTPPEGYRTLLLQTPLLE